jgi:hypothetical protein
VTGISWSRPDSGVRTDIIGLRDLPDGRTEYLMHNEALGNPYYTAMGAPETDPCKMTDDEYEMFIYGPDRAEWPTNAAELKTIKGSE